MASATLNNIYYYILYIIRYILLILLYYCAGSVNVFEEILLAGESCNSKYSTNIVTQCTRYSLKAIKPNETHMI